MLDSPEIDKACAARLESSLISYCSDMDVEIHRELAAACVQHLLMVAEENKKMNLTRITDLDEAVVLHLVDSLILSPLLDDAPSGSFLDMGTGAGFPGIPLVLASGREAVLLDSVGKKVAAVSGFCDALNLDRVDCVHARLEDYAAQRKHSFAAVVARALAPMPTLIEYAAPFLIPHGCFIVTKGNPSPDEIASGEKAAAICGLKCIHHSEIDLPAQLGHRTLFVFERVSKPTRKLPRAVGQAKKNPLA